MADPSLRCRAGRPPSNVVQLDVRRYDQVMYCGAVTFVVLAALLFTPICGFAGEPGNDGGWKLVTRHGTCEDINSLKRKIPDLPTIASPVELLEFVDKAGHFAEFKELPGSAGRAYQIDISDLSLHLVIVQRALCAKSQAEY